MAVDTHAGVRYMVNRHCGCTHGTELRVTADAGGHRSFERTTGMATITGHIGVCAIKLEPGTEMIERILCVHIRRSSQQKQTGTQAPENPFSWF